MPRSAHQKEKLLSLLEILFRDTDQDHPLPLAGLIEALERQGISAERKSIYADLETLRQRAGTSSWTGAGATTWPPAL